MSCKNSKISIDSIINKIQGHSLPFFTRLMSKFLMNTFNEANFYNEFYNFDATELANKKSSNPELFDMSICNEHEFMLEKKFLALKYPICWLYVYLSVTFKFFSTKFVSENQTIEYLNRIFNHCTLVRPYIPMLVLIHQSFTIGENYHIEIQSQEFAWNDLILSKLALQQIEFEKLRNYSLGKCGVNKNKNSYPRKTIANRIDLGKVRKNANILLNDRTCSANVRALLTDMSCVGTKRNYIEGTHEMSPMINGTACVGKTTIINKLMGELKSIDPNAEVLKCGKLGGYQGKDSNQILAMQAQMVLYDAATTHYTSVMDRDPSNNLLWRIILQLMSSTDDIVSKFMDILMDISPSEIDALSRLPVAVIIDTNCIENRKRMKSRGASYGDNYRCFIEMYVPVQNMVHGVFATMCNWILLDRSHEDCDIHYSMLSQLMINKIKHNITRRSLPTARVSSPYILQTTTNSDDETAFNTSINLNIFK